MTVLSATLPRMLIGAASSQATGGSIGELIERAFLLASGSSSWLSQALKGKGKAATLLQTAIDIHATSPVRMYNPKGKGLDDHSTLTYANGEPAVMRTRRGDLKYPVDAATDTWLQPASREYVAARAAETEAKRANPNPNRMLVTDTGIILRDFVDQLPAPVGILLDFCMRGWAKYARELPGFAAGLAGLFRGLQTLSTSLPVFKGKTFKEASARVSAMLHAPGVAPSGAPRVLQNVADWFEDLAQNPNAYRAIYDLRRLPALTRSIRAKAAEGASYATDARKAVALSFHAVAEAAARFFNDEAGRWLSCAGRIAVALSVRTETNLPSFKPLGFLRGGLRVTQAVATAAYPRLVKQAEAYIHALPEDQQGSARGVLNIVSALLLPDRGIYRGADRGNQFHPGMGKGRGRPFVNDQQQIWGLDEIRREELALKDPATLTDAEREELAKPMHAYQQTVLRTADHPAPEGLFGDFMRVVKAASLDKDSWDVALRLINSIEKSPLPATWQKRLTRVLLVSMKQAAGFKNPHDGEAFHRYNPHGFDAFSVQKSGDGFVVEEKPGDFSAWGAREPAMWLETLHAIWRELYYGDEAGQVVAKTAPDLRPPKPGESVSFSQDGEIPVSAYQALRAGVGGSKEQLTLLWRAGMDILARVADNKGKPDVGRTLRLMGDVPYHASMSHLTVT